MLRLALIIALCLASSPLAAEEQGAPNTYEQRLELADQMLEINPPRDQVRNAVNRYIEKYMTVYSPEARQAFRIKMFRIINYRALEKISREAYADVFTLEELAAMVEYYSKPEAKTAREKQPDLNEKIAPEIARMIDQAIMRARTSAE